MAVKIKEITTIAINGDEQQMDLLISSLKTNTLNGEDFASFLMTMKQNLHLVTKDHEVLIGYILTCEWSSHNDDVVKIFINFITELVSAKTYFLKVCIRTLVKQFSVKSEVTGDELSKLHRKFDFVHQLLQAIVAIVPLSPKFISEAVISYFPYIGKSLFVLDTYTVNILQIITYARGIRYQVLANLIDMMLSIDVRIPRHKIEENTESENLQFQVDDPEMSLPKNNLTLQVEKLDQLMHVLFTYVGSLCKVNDEFKWKQTKSLFKDFLQIYEDVILKTQQSSHVQFVLFYTASFHKELSKDFVDLCWNIFETPSNAQIIRQASSSFLASFLARSNFLEKEFISQQLKRMSDWLLRYLKLQDGNNIQPDYRKHAAFYSACQTLFYVFLYHHYLYVDSSKGIAYLKSLDFSRIVLSKLNPLRYCLKTVVNMFARITRMYEIVFCYSTIDRNNRSDDNKLILQQELEVDAKHMEVFFPFDPYMLPRSGQFIKPLYHEWKGTLHDDDNDDDGDDEDEKQLENDMDEVDDLFESMEHHLALNDFSGSKKSAHSFDMMSISPGFSLHNR